MDPVRPEDLPPLVEVVDESSDDDRDDHLRDLLVQAWPSLALQNA